MDLAVDEQGLWVLWGNAANSNRLSASKIEGDVLVRNYNLATGKALFKVRFNDVAWEIHLKNSNLKQF